MEELQLNELQSGAPVDPESGGTKDIEVSEKATLPTAVMNNENNSQAMPLIPAFRARNEFSEVIKETIAES